VTCAVCLSDIESDVQPKGIGAEIKHLRDLGAFLPGERPRRGHWHWLLLAGQGTQVLEVSLASRLDEISAVTA